MMTTTASPATPRAGAVKMRTSMARDDGETPTIVTGAIAQHLQIQMQALPLPVTARATAVAAAALHRQQRPKSSRWVARPSPHRRTIPIRPSSGTGLSTYTVRTRTGSILHLVVPANTASTPSHQRKLIVSSNGVSCASGMPASYMTITTWARSPRLRRPRRVIGSLSATALRRTRIKWPLCVM